MVVEAEISRDKVPLRNAYKHVGQRAALRINSGIEHSLQGALCPLSLYLAYSSSAQLIGRHKSCSVSWDVVALLRPYYYLERQFLGAL